MATTLQFASEATFEAPPVSASVDIMARLYFASFWAILLTGAIRKWLAPGTAILYLLQDVPIGAAYLYGLWKGLFDRGYLFLGIILLSTIILLQGLTQIVISGLDVFVAFVGFHNYLFYLPMLLVFPLCLTEKHRRDFVRCNLFVSIPMCLLAIVQALSPRSAFINQSTGGDAFGVPGADIARVTGTFNFVAFYNIWVGIAVALCMGEWLLPKARRAVSNQWLLLLCTFTVNLCHLVSASRGAIMLAGVGVLGGMVGAILLGSNRAMLAIGGICVLLPVAAGMTYVISPTEFNIVVDRFTGESRGESDLPDRVLQGLIGFATVPKFSLIGAGIGMGVDAAHLGDANAYNFTYDLSEQDTVRNVMELGTPVGLLYVLARLGFIYGMLFLSIRMVRKGTSPHLLPLSFVLLASTYQDLTRNATMTATQSMIGYAFILGAYYYPDAITNPNSGDGESLMRSA